MTGQTVSATGMRLIRLLVGRPPRSVAELTKELGITRTGVMEQINELMAAGFVERSLEHLPGRGRPRNLFTTTDAALLLLFAGNQAVLVPAMWKAITELGGREMACRVVDRVAETLSEQYRRRISGTTPEERFREMSLLLREEGVEIEMDEQNDGLILYKRSCPFISMFEESESVCCVDQKMMALVVGRPVQRRLCRHRGDPCCSFVLADPEEASS